jgi:hypothetical protein
MKNFKTLFIILVSVIIIVGCAFFKSFKEGLTNNDDNYNFVLIGDSVLNNSNYVPSGKSVVDNLKTKTTKVFDFAKDGATIEEIIPTFINNLTDPMVDAMAAYIRTYKSFGLRYSAVDQTWHFVEQENLNTTLDPYDFSLDTPRVLPPKEPLRLKN